MLQQERLVDTITHVDNSLGCVQIVAERSEVDQLLLVLPGWSLTESHWKLCLLV